MEIPELNLRTIIIVTLNAVAILLVAVIAIGFLDVIIGEDAEDFRARRNMHLLSDRIAAVDEHGLTGDDAKVILDVPHSYGLLLVKGGSVGLEVVDLSDDCPGDSACICTIENYDDRDDWRTSECVEIDFMSIFFADAPNEEINLIAPGPRTVGIRVERDEVILTQPALLDCSRTIAVGDVSTEDRDFVLQFCHGKEATDRQGDVLFYVGGDSGAGVGDDPVCYECRMEKVAGFGGKCTYRTVSTC